MAGYAKRRRTPNPVTTNRNCWIPGSQPSACGRRLSPGMTMHMLRNCSLANSCAATRSGRALSAAPPDAASYWNQSFYFFAAPANPPNRFGSYLVPSNEGSGAKSTFRHIRPHGLPSWSSSRKPDAGGPFAVRTSWASAQGDTPVPPEQSHSGWASRPLEAFSHPSRRPLG